MRRSPCWPTSRRTSSASPSTRRSRTSPPRARLFGAPADIADRVRARVRDELGLPISIGVARTKHLAKIASQVAKPDGLVVVDPAGELAFLHDLPVELMWGVGPATRARLADAGVTTIGQLAQSSTWAMERLLGRAVGRKLTALAWNRDPRAIQTRATRPLGRRAVGPGAPAGDRGRLPPRPAAPGRPHRAAPARQGSSLPNGDRSRPLCRPPLGHPGADAAGADLRHRGAGGRGHRAGARGAGRQPGRADDLALGDLRVQSRRGPGSCSSNCRSHLADDGRRPGTRRGIARLRADRAIDAIRERFGWEAVNYASAAPGASRSVPDDFRSLAEKEL